MGFVKTILRYLVQYKWLFGIFVFCLLIEVAYTVAAPLSLQYLVDEAFIPKSLRTFLIILSILFGAGFINICASLYGDYSINRLSGQVNQQMRSKLFNHLQLQSSGFYQRFQIGDLVTRFAADMSSIERVFRVTSPMFLCESLSILLGLTMLFSIEWRLTLAMIAGSILMFVGPKLLQGRAESTNMNLKQAQEKFSNTIDEMIKGQKTIRSLHLQGTFRDRAMVQIRGLFTLGLRMHVLGSLMERLPVATLFIMNGIMIGYGGYLIFHDVITIGGFMAFFTLFMSVGQAASNMAYLIPDLIDSSISFRRIGEIMEVQPSVQEIENPQNLDPTLASIRMENVTFGYSEESSQLQNINLRIAPRKYVAFVGLSGSGKSTALQLLSRFYDPDQGAVYINDYDMRTVSEASLRQLVTLVTQDTFLFNTTIRENLLHGHQHASEEEMIEAAKLTRIHDVIAAWPEAYDTQIHHDGGSLSGGERQRISLARALLKKPQLLLLDEITSALDPVSEADINQMLQQLRGHTTIVMVTHRLDAVRNADEIHVFDKGRVVENGTHEELMEQRGLYSEMWRKQHGFHLSRDGLDASVETTWLANLPFFAGIKMELLNNIAAMFSTEICNDGDTIVREGEEGNKFYMVVRGKFEVLKGDPEGGRKSIAVLHDGDYFGEIALLKNIARTATVKAMCHSILLSIRQEAFQRLTTQYPHIREVLERTLQQRTAQGGAS